MSGFEFQVAGVSASIPAANYSLDLEVNGTLGPRVRLAPTMWFTISGSGDTITWTDIGAEGNLNAGDTIRVMRSGGPPPSTTFVVSFLWTDGIVIASVSYTS